MTLELEINNITYKLSNWEVRNYQTTDNSSIPGCIFRSTSGDGFKNYYLPFVGGNDIGLYLSLTDPEVHYRVIGSGNLLKLADSYNQTYNYPIYSLCDLEKAKESIDSFLIKAKALLVFL